MKEICVLLGITVCEGVRKDGNDILISRSYKHSDSWWSTQELNTAWTKHMCVCVCVSHPVKRMWPALQCHSDWFYLIRCHWRDSGHPAQYNSIKKGIYIHYFSGPSFLLGCHQYIYDIWPNSGAGNCKKTVDANICMQQNICIHPLLATASSHVEPQPTLFPLFFFLAKWW